MLKVAIKFFALPTVAVLACSASLAQTALAPPNIPEIKLIDRNMIDLVSGFAQFNTPLVSIGPETGGFGDSWAAIKSEFWEGNMSPLVGGVKYDPTIINRYVASFNGRSERFQLSGGVYSSLTQAGGTLVKGVDGIFIHTLSDGTVVRSDPARLGIGSNDVAGVIDVTMPDGRKLVFNYKDTSYYWPPQSITHYRYRLQSVTRSDGFQIRYVYAADTPGPNGETSSDWHRVSQVVAVNGAIDYCDPLANSCTYSRSWPTASIAWVMPNGNTNGSMTLTDAAGRVTRYTINSEGHAVGVKPPSSDTETATYEYCYKYKTPLNCFKSTVGGSVGLAPGRALKAVVDGQTWTYSFHSGSGYEPSSYSGGGPVGRTLNVVSQSASGNLITASVADGTRHVYNLDVNNRVSRSEHPDGRITSYTYDPRGNVTQTDASPVSGSGLGTISRRAGYDETCSNVKTCNKPNWVRDALNNQMDFTYDPQHGGVKTQTWPAFGPNNIRPQRRYFYSQRYAWVKNSGGSYSQSANPIWVLTEERWCKTGAASGDNCAIPGDQVIKTYEYGPDAGPNNLLLRGTVEDAGGLNLRTCYKYDDYGRMISQTPPKAGLSSCS